MKRKFIYTAYIGLVIFALAAGAGAAETIRCASTTSTQNSGLFDFLLPGFTAASDIEVQVIAVGTGAALNLGKRGDVDVVFVHARDTELQMVKEGWFVNRRDIMYNDFVLVGPAADPAGVKTAGSAAGALQKIAAASASFVSRGDDSGTHKKERQLWHVAGTNPLPERDPWYLTVGQGMAKTLRVAGEKQAYTLTDRGTWLAIKDQADLALAIVFEGDQSLFNQYGVMMVNPVMHDHVKKAAAEKFIDWLVSDQGQQAINAFRSARGDRLFVANAKSFADQLAHK